MNRFLCVAALFSLLSCPLVASAGSIQAVVTADNHYGLYVGKADGSDLALIGRNEFGAAGSPGAYNWTLPEAWDFSADDYLYVVAWDDGGAQSWIGEFTLPSGTSLYSNTTDWEHYVSDNPNPGSNGNLPSLAALEAEIAGAGWAAPGASAPNGASPWGTIAGISSSADFIWHDTLSANSKSDNSYVIFRSGPIEMQVPEPAGFAVWSIIGGIGFVGGIRRRRNG